MMDFKPITLSDKSSFDNIFKGNNYRSSDLSFMNLFAWAFRYKTQKCIIENTLFLRTTCSIEQFCYMMPIGEMPLEKALDLIVNDAEENSVPFRMIGISSQMWEKINTSSHGKFKLTEYRDDDEYIYLTERLINLSGKKLQSKRNHINRFKTENPDWEYIKISTEEHIQQCLDMLDEWENESIGRLHESQQFDYIATRVLLQNFHILEVRGGAIKANGKVVAFSLGEPLTEDTFVVHVEKAFSDIIGAYTIINQQFVMHEASSYKYVNREEDMGIENLRKAKMSYQPEIILKQGVVSLNE